MDRRVNMNGLPGYGSPGIVVEPNKHLRNFAGLINGLAYTDMLKVAETLKANLGPESGNAADLSTIADALLKTAAALESA